MSKRCKVPINNWKPTLRLSNFVSLLGAQIWQINSVVDVRKFGIVRSTIKNLIGQLINYLLKSSKQNQRKKFELASFKQSNSF